MNRKHILLKAMIWFLLWSNAAVASFVFAISPKANSYTCSGYVGCLIASRDLNNAGYFMLASVLLSIGIYGLFYAYSRDLCE